MRLIEADAFAAEMKKRQDACQERIDNPNEDAFWTDREHWYGVMATFSEVKLTLYTMPTVGGWVSVKDRLPEEQAPVLVYVPPYSDEGEEYKGQVAMAYYTYSRRGGYWTGTDGIYGATAIIQDPSYWMPLPEPPKEVSGDD